MVMLPNFKVKSPVEAFNKAWMTLAIVYDRSEFVRHLAQVRMVNYAEGHYTLEAPTQYIADVFNRHAENNIIRKELAMYVPEGIMVTVEAVAAKAVAS